MMDIQKYFGTKLDSLKEADNVELGVEMLRTHLENAAKIVLENVSES